MSESCTWIHLLLFYTFQKSFTVIIFELTALYEQVKGSTVEIHYVLKAPCFYIHLNHWPLAIWKVDNAISLSGGWHSYVWFVLDTFMNPCIAISLLHSFICPLNNWVLVVKYFIKTRLTGLYYGLTKSYTKFTCLLIARPIQTATIGYLRKNNCLLLSHHSDLKCK